MHLLMINLLVMFWQGTSWLELIFDKTLVKILKYPSKQALTTFSIEIKKHKKLGSKELLARVLFVFDFSYPKRFFF